MSFKPKSHKALGDEEWMARLRGFSSDGVWPSNAGNRPAPRQKKWHALYQKPNLVARKPPGPSLPSLRTPSLAPSSVRTSGPLPSSVRTPSLAPSSVRTSGPPPSSVRTPSLAPSSVRTPSLASSSTTPTHICQTVSPEPAACVQQSDAAGDAGPGWLPSEMRKTIPVQDQRWMGNTLFHAGKVRPDFKLWYEPPVPALIYHQVPTPDRFFTHRLLVWMPYHQWKVRVFCQACGKHLTGAGVPPHAPALAPTKALRKLTRKVLHNTCKKCGQFRIAETGHSQYRGHIYCPSNESMTKELWL
ncbi:uncharacterized protein LOC124857485 isoform X2 [Girardinichthys multiradiatus]|uniref:uncharacterized protein LOC124857485 isoform X2 n=1 Tax=Girardinichthys multiradiatus TaxID=208333 RepID=UPI001FAD9C5E|nr:uncharacterized protein LOC124857485 isoform X2 [Girardinichthys multiradiatus]